MKTDGIRTMSTFTHQKPKWRRIPLRQIRAFTRRIAERFHPEKVILFGSYAYGKPTYDSDVDLLVIMNTRLREVDQAVQIRSAFDAPFPLDLMVRRPQTIRHRIALGDYFLEEITSQGKVLYESSHQRVDRKGGGRLSRMPARASCSQRS